MADRDRPESGVRRRLLKASALAAGSVAVGSLPWSRPEIKSFFGVRSAYAVPTFALTQTAQGQLGTLPPGTPDPAAGRDRWEFPVYSPDTQVTVTVASLDGFSDLEIYLYRCDDIPPSGSTLGLTNLLTGNPFGLNQGGVGASEGGTLLLAPLGSQTAYPVCYALFVEDARPPASEVAGEYQITLVADKEIGCPQLVQDEGPEGDGPETG